MGFGGLGPWEILLIFLVVLLLFGAKRLPEIGSSLGKGIREFKGSLREIENEMKAPLDTQPRSQTPAPPAENAPAGEPRRLSATPVHDSSPPQGTPGQEEAQPATPPASTSDPEDHQA
jgi:sec-independent protein translocase protein TatA